jgi:DNA-binding transcriptional ArsR family regulator
MVSVMDAISALSDKKALLIFKYVALSESNRSNILITRLGLTRRQFYSGMKRLSDAGLITRIGSIYRLTSLGKIVFTMYRKIENAIDNHHWKLKAVDSIIISPDAEELTIEEIQNVITKLIDDHEMKAILLPSIRSAIKR